MLELARLIEKSKDAICLNVRRGDFIGSKNHEVVDLAYYFNAIKNLKIKLKSNPQIFIFSDDIEWCRSNLSKISENVIFVEHVNKEQSSFVDLYLMTRFSNYIIPNSTFAWWGAWLSAAKNKTVITPQAWSGIERLEPKDIVPDSWKICN